MAYSIDFIRRAVAYRQEGHTFSQLREAFDIPSATYYDWEVKLNNGYFDTIIKRERHRKIDKEALKLYIPVKKLQLSSKIDPRVHENRSRSPKQRSIPKDPDFVRTVLDNALVFSH